MAPLSRSTRYTPTESNRRKVLIRTTGRHCRCDAYPDASICIGGARSESAFLDCASGRRRRWAWRRRPAGPRARRHRVPGSPPLHEPASPGAPAWGRGTATRARIRRSETRRSAVAGIHHCRTRSSGSWLERSVLRAVPFCSRLLCRWIEPLNLLVVCNLQVRNKIPQSKLLSPCREKTGVPGKRNPRPHLPARRASGVGPTGQWEHEAPHHSPPVDPRRPRPASLHPKSPTTTRPKVQSLFPREEKRDGLLQQPELRFAGQPRDAVALHGHRRPPRRQIEGAFALSPNLCPSKFCLLFFFLSRFSRRFVGFTQFCAHLVILILV